MSGPHDSSSLSACQVEIITALGMDKSLVSNKGSRVSLETIWKCYTAITKAISGVGGTDWESGKKPTDSEIIGIYNSKLVFYDQSKVLQHVRHYSDMVEWLERSDADQADETTNFSKQFTLLKTWRGGLYRNSPNLIGRGRRRLLSNLILRKAGNMMMVMNLVVLLLKGFIRSQ